MSELFWVAYWVWCWLFHRKHHRETCGLSWCAACGSIWIERFKRRSPRAESE